MKAVKAVLKPFIVVSALLGVGVLIVVKVLIAPVRAKFRYKFTMKVDRQIQKLYAVVFSPYRISNGIVPRRAVEYKYSASDLEKCHEIFLKRRQEA